MSKEKQQSLQQKLIELQLLEQQTKEAQQYQQILTQKLMELNRLKDSLADLENSKINKQLFSQLGPRVFIKSELKDNKNVLVDVGSDIVVEKSVEDTIEIISQESNETNTNIKLINQHILNILSQIQNLQQELNSMQK